MGRYKIFIAVLLCFFSTFASAALTTKQLRNQDEYAAAMSKQMRNYDSMEAKVNYNNLKNQINGAMSASKTLSDGSRAASASSIAKAADAARAAGTIAGRFAKASVPAFVGSMALDGLIKGIGWVMDDGSKVVKRPADAADQDLRTMTKAWRNSWVSTTAPNAFFTTPDLACTALNASIGFASSNYNHTGFYTSSTSYNCHFSSGTGTTSLETNPNYNPNVSITYVPASQQDITNAIQKYLQDNPNTDITNNIYVSAYTPDMQFALSDQVNVLASEMSDQMAQSLEAAAKSATGNASVTIYGPDGAIIVGSATSQIDLYGTGSTTTTSETSTTTNADGTTSTTTTQGSQQSDWPAFCDYASIMCDWYSWTKDTYSSAVTSLTDFLTPDNNDNSVDVQDPQQDDSNFSFSLPAACPAPIQLINSSFMGVPINWQYDFADFCTILTDYVRPILIAMGAFIAVLILGGVRTTDD